MESDDASGWKTVVVYEYCYKAVHCFPVFAHTVYGMLDAG